MRLFAKIVLILATIVYIVSSSDVLMRASRDLRWVYRPLMAYRNRYGDLYGITRLGKFKTPLPDYRMKKTGCDTVQRDSIALYVIGDSYLKRAPRLNDAICHIASYDYIPWDDRFMAPKPPITLPVSTVMLDTARRNVLVIESVERYARRRLAKPEQAMGRIIQGTPNRSLFADYPLGGDFNEWATNFFRNPHIEQNLELNLFENSVCAPLMEAKGYINAYWFDRIPSRVAVSRDNSFLLMSETVETTGNISPFAPFSPTQEEDMVASLNAIRQHYLEFGFDEVYFSIIPNPVTILDPTWHTYNGLIPRLETNPKLEAPVVSVYNLYRQRPQGIFLRDDTHWDKPGMEIWVREVSRVVR